MSLETIVYCCNDLKDDKRNFIQSFKEALEKRTFEEATQLLGQEVFITNLLYKKDFERGNFKLIIQQLEIENENIFCFRKILKHKAKEYQELYNAPQKWLDNNQIPENDIENIIGLIRSEKERKAKESKLSPLPDDLKAWLKQPQIDLEATIYESEKWVSKSNSDFDLYWEKYCKLLTNIIDNKQKDNRVININDKVKLAYRGEHYILYEPISRKIRDGDTDTIYFLFANFKAPSQESAREKAEKILNDFPNFQNCSEMLPYARRAYPYRVLAAEDLW